MDVPNASLMVIEHAERFGLSQLHQLRGRVGRGAAASACVLLYSAGEGGRLGETARARLKAMVETADGFEIARRDLEIRGPGEFLGARQSGAPLLRFADLAADIAAAGMGAPARAPDARSPPRTGPQAHGPLVGRKIGIPQGLTRTRAPMTLTELKYIVAVAREKHFGKAAEACFVSQPTLSVAIKKLEDELEVKLFERSANEVTVTPLGEDIVRQAQSVLEQAANIKEIAKRGKDPLAGPLKLGVIYTIGPYLLPDLVRQAISRTPQMPLMLQENFTVKLLEMLRTGDIDCAIMAEPFPDTGLAVAPALRRAVPRGGAQQSSAGGQEDRARRKSSRARPCCCWAPVTAFATTCWRCARSSRAFPATPKASARASKARRSKRSSTWWPPAWA